MKYTSIVIIALFISCFNFSGHISIIPLENLSNSDTVFENGNPVIKKAVFFLITNYKNNKKVDQLIDSFVYSKKHFIAKYAEYEMLFYKESDKTNVANIEKDKRVIDRYSQDNDWVYFYKWNYGKLTSRWKLKNGEIIEPKNTIIIEDVDSIKNK